MSRRPIAGPVHPRPSERKTFSLDRTILDPRHAPPDAFGSNPLACVGGGSRRSRGHVSRPTLTRACVSFASRRVGPDPADCPDTGRGSNERHPLSPRRLCSRSRCPASSSSNLIGSDRGRRRGRLLPVVRRAAWHEVSACPGICLASGQAQEDGRGRERAKDSWVGCPRDTRAFEADGRAAGRDANEDMTASAAGASDPTCYTN
jgi:hypothetical protein